MLLLFFCVWIIFNGAVTVEILMLDMILTAAMFWFICRFMDYDLEKEWKFYQRIPLLARYAVVLLREILKANAAVFHMILTRKENIEPVLVHVRTDLKTETARVILANSITLTPGTITVSMTEHQLLVHCLDKSLAEGMEDSVFVELLRKMEEGEVWN